MTENLHQALLSRGDVTELLRQQSGPCVSIFMPTHRAGPETRQDPIRFKNLLVDAKHALTSRGMRSPDAAKLLHSAELLRDDSMFWSYQSDGLACFVAPRYTRVERVPLAMEAELHVGSRFFIKPLLPLLGRNGRFLVLALSQHSVRLFEATADSMRELPLGDVPQNVASLVPDRRVDGTVQYHSATPAVGHKGIGAPIYHGTDPETEKADIARFFREVDRRVSRHLRGETAPMVLACVNHLAAMYARMNSYPHLLPAAVSGNAEAWTDKELHAKAYEVAEPYLRRPFDEAREKYARNRGTGLASSDVNKIIPAAHQGHIDTLFLTSGAVLRGRYEPAGQHVVLDGEGEDLVETVAAETLLSSGAVYAVNRDQIPEQSAMAAVFRYSA